MRDRSAKRSGCGSFRVHMNPLVVAGGIGKQVDLLLCDGDPVADRDLLADAAGQLGDGFKYFHRLTLTVELKLWLPRQ